MSLIYYPKCENVRINRTFSVRVREEGGQWKELTSYDARNMYKGGMDNEIVTRMSYVYFDSDFEKTIELEIKYNGEDIQTAKIRPLSYNINYNLIDSKTLTFTMQQPQKISVEINNNIYRNLHIFASLHDKEAPSANDPKVKYFPAGFHSPGDIYLNDDEMVYIAGGAFVMGRVIAKGVKNVSVKGRGVLCGTNIPMAHEYMIFFHECEGASVDGIIIQDSPGWTIVPRDSVNIHIKNVKIMNYRECSDGMNPCGSSNLLMEDVFLRIPDDCVSIKAFRAKKPNCNITIKDSIFWADAAHAVLIGPEGNGTVTENITFDNIDILEVKCPWPEYYGVLAITNGDDMVIRNIVFRNIRIEEFSQSSLICLRIEENAWTYAPGKNIENILFKDVTYTGNNKNHSVLRGFNAERNLRGIRFENYNINGKLVKSADEFGLVIEDNVHDVSFG